MSAAFVPVAVVAQPVLDPGADRAAFRCVTADPDDIVRKAAFAASLIEAVQRLERFDPEAAAYLLNQIELCCDLVADLDPDQRTLMAARLAYAARLIAEHDEELARELDRLIELCGDRVIDVSYGAARGADGTSDTGPQSFGASDSGGGGVPSDN